MENHPVYKYYKDYVKINGRIFLWKEISVSHEKRIVVDNINGFNRPVLQFLGPKESTISLTIEYGGIYSAPQVSTSVSSSTFKTDDSLTNLTTIARTEKRTTAEGLRDSFLDQKNFIESLTRSNTAKLIKLELPDGDKVNCILSKGTKSYFSLGLNTEQLELIILGSIQKNYKPVDKSKILDIKTKTLNLLKSELLTGGVPSSFMDKIKDSKLASWLSKATEKTKGLYKSFRKYANLTKEYISKVQNILTKVQNTINTAMSALQEPLKILNMLKQINKMIVDIAKTPGMIVDAMQNICDGIHDYINDTKNTFKCLTKMFDFGDKKQSGKSGSGKKYYNLNTIQKEIMENEVKETSNIVFFINALTTSLDIQYNNDEELAEVITQLNDMYDSLSNDENISDNMKDLLFSGYNETKNYLLNETEVVKNIKYINITTPRTLLNIVFEYYGSIDLYDDILALNQNNLKDVLQVSGRIKVFDV